MPLSRPERIKGKADNAFSIRILQTYTAPLPDRGKGKNPLLGAALPEIGLRLSGGPCTTRISGGNQKTKTAAAMTVV